MFGSYLRPLPPILNLANVYSCFTELKNGDIPVRYVNLYQRVTDSTNSEISQLIEVITIVVPTPCNHGGLNLKKPNMGRIWMRCSWITQAVVLDHFSRPDWINTFRVENGDLTNMGSELNWTKVEEVKESGLKQQTPLDSMSPINVSNCNQMIISIASINVASKRCKQTTNKHLSADSTAME